MSRSSNFLTLGYLGLLLAVALMMQPTFPPIAAMQEPSKTVVEPAAIVLGKWKGSGSTTSGLVRAIEVEFRISEKRIENMVFRYILEGGLSGELLDTLSGDIVENSFSITAYVIIPGKTDVITADLKGAFVADSKIEGTFSYKGGSFSWSAAP